jgi:ribosomal protein L37AE/L43A
MKATVVTHTYIVCPYCGEDEKRVDHLDAAGRTFGPWYCDECGKAYRGKRVADGVEIELLDEICHRVMIELRHHADDNLRIVVWGMRFEGASWQTGVDTAGYPEHHRFYYDEHTCPTNYLSNVIEIREGDIDDPHGVFRFVRELSADEQREMEEKHGL